MCALFYSVVLRPSQRYAQKETAIDAEAGGDSFASGLAASKGNTEAV